MELTFATLRGLSGKTDVTDVPCPVCAGECKTSAGRKRKCLRIWDDGGDFITFTCARCGTAGYAKPDDGSTQGPVPKVDKAPEPKVDKSGLCRFLWDKSQPAIGSIVQRYLEARGCWNGPRSTVRYLPAREHQGRLYEPAMISRFGFEDEPVTGVHLTKLKPDGSGKANTDPNKLTMGDTIGQPVVVHDHDTSEHLIIAEGYEDTESLIRATGWSGWMAGTAGRIPAVVATAVKRGFKTIYVAKDVDHKSMTTGQAGASTRALEQASAIAPIVPLSFGGTVFGLEHHLDANVALQKYGKDWLWAAVEWCDLQVQFERKLLTFHQLDRMRQRLKKILFPGS